ncbi:hypothetical protein RB195_009649 [Necator americanus]
MFGTVARFWSSFGIQKKEDRAAARSRIQKKEDRAAARSRIQKKEDRAAARSRIQKKEDRAEAAQTSPSRRPKMPRGAEGKASEPQLENFLAAMVEQMRIQHEEMKTLLTALAPTQRTTVQDVSKD